ncbi:hypothetical protein [Chitinophaga rhizophila]|uniref:Uncharacterized protein n=1 Tax=Chitinophaga rhizophila TaxID=2866212 RepID=A0ABS7GA33_9BACT|nr:hypothetical protein [Chitinophaga rhizophila]MBW8683398.1 hypothetical protein [Chitinophaga rhizophila]
MWRRKQKFKPIDDFAVKKLTYKLPGVDNSKIVPVDFVRGTEYFWGFIPDKYQPKPITEIILEQIAEKRKQEREAANKQQ